jgi:hypothetical protein
VLAFGESKGNFEGVLGAMGAIECHSNLLKHGTSLAGLSEAVVKAMDAVSFTIASPEGSWGAGYR